jgi:exonuclease SbcD
VRIVHTSDWHLGRRLGRVDRTPDLRRAIQQVADACTREQADVLLVCGDLFDQGRAEVLRYWTDQLNQIFAPFLRGGGTILALTGNHDNENTAQMLRQAMSLAAPAPNELGGTLAPGRFYLFTGPTFFSLPDREGLNVQFIAMPFPTPSRYLKTEEAQSYQGIDERSRVLKSAYASTLQGILAHPKFDPARPAVLATHILTSGAELRVAPTEGDGVVLRDADLPTHLAYVALGDVHKPHNLLDLSHVRYCGSIDRMDLGESGEEKGVVVVDIAATGRAGDPRWTPIVATPLYYVEVEDPQTNVPLLIDKYPDHDRALVKFKLRYRAGRDDLNGLLAEMYRIFPRYYESDWEEISGISDVNASITTTGDGEPRSVRQTVLQYLESQLNGDADRQDILRLAEALVAEHEQRQ